jgi:hypothetical protein
MRYTFIIFLFCNSLTFAQNFTHKKNQVFLNAGNETPYIGVSYHRSIWLQKNSVKASHFEVGAGIGWVPKLFDDPSGKPWAYSHSLNYVFGKKWLFGTINYAGIIAPKDRLFRSRHIYTPKPSVGIRLQLYDVGLGFNINAYLFSEENLQIVNENDLVKKIQNKIFIVPGAYLSYKF